MSDDWVALLPSMVYSRIVSEFSAQIKKDYGMTNSNFSSEMSSDAPSIFPFVNVSQMEANAVEEDLEITQINEIPFTIQIDVYDNKNQQTAKTVAYEVLRIMRKMKFTPMPIPTPIKEGGGVKRMTARYQRKIDWNDVL